MRFSQTKEHLTRMTNSFRPVFQFIYSLPWLVTLLSAAIALFLRGAEAFLHARGERSRRVFAVLSAVSVLLVVVFTLVFREEGATPRVTAEAFYSVRKFLKTGDPEKLRSFWMNILLFLPFGMTFSGLAAPAGISFYAWSQSEAGRTGARTEPSPLGGAAKRFLFAAGAGLVLSAAVEILQYVFQIGTFETDDLIANTAGAMLGAVTEPAAAILASILAWKPRSEGLAKCIDMLNRKWHVVSYIYWGGVTTLVNWLVFFSLSGKIHYLAANTAAWIVSVAFAFCTNRAFVFRSSSKGLRLLREGLLFAAGRVFSLGVETLLMWLGVGLLHIPSAPVKVIVAIIIAVMNFFIGKFIVFTKKTAPEPEDF